MMIKEEKIESTRIAIIVIKILAMVMIKTVAAKKLSKNSNAGKTSQFVLSVDIIFSRHE